MKDSVCFDKLHTIILDGVPYFAIEDVAELTCHEAKDVPKSLVFGQHGCSFVAPDTDEDVHLVDALAAQMIISYFIEKDGPVGLVSDGDPWAEPDGAPEDDGPDDDSASDESDDDGQDEYDESVEGLLHNILVTLCKIWASL